MQKEFPTATPEQIAQLHKDSLSGGVSGVTMRERIERYDLSSLPAGLLNRYSSAAIGRHVLDLLDLDRQIADLNARAAATRAALARWVANAGGQVEAGGVRISVSESGELTIEAL